jgi:hypothetical protein
MRREPYKIEILLKTIGWKYFTLLLFYCFSIFVFNGNVLSKYKPFPDTRILEYIIRFMIFQIPASITIFSFVYKEKKDASYSNLKTTNIFSLFIWTIGVSFITLIFSLISITGNPAIGNFDRHQLNICLVYAIFSVFLLIIYVYKLIRNMDIKYSLDITLNKTNKYIDLLKYIMKCGSKSKLGYNHILRNFNSLMESNFQLLISLISKKKVSEIEKELEKIYVVTKEVHSLFFHFDDYEQFRNFFNYNEKNSLYHNIINKCRGLLEQDPIEVVANKDALIELYKTIILNYRLLIREASKNQLTKVQKQAYVELISISPIKLYKTGFNGFNDEEFNDILIHYDELASIYYYSLFEIIKEFSDEGTVEYSYLLEQLLSIKGALGFFQEMSTIEIDGRSKVLYETFISKIFGFLESVVILSIESNNIRFLTDSINTLLKFYYTHIQYVDLESNLLKKKIEKEMGFNLDEIIFANEDFKEPTTKNMIFKKTVGERTIEIVIYGLHKSIEIGNYGCGGYLTKISCSHFLPKDIINCVNAYIKKAVVREEHQGYIDYYHYLINNYSKVHCLQKLVLLIGYQLVFRKGLTKNDATLNKLKDLIRLIFLDDINSLKYMIQKIEQAKSSYGMVSIDAKQESILNSFLQKTKTN